MAGVVMYDVTRQTVMLADGADEVRMHLQQMARTNTVANFIDRSGPFTEVVSHRTDQWSVYLSRSGLSSATP